MQVLNDSITKETIDNSHITEFNKVATSFSYETKTIDGNSLQPNECARFTITTDNKSNIVHFDFGIKGKAGIILASNLENISGNKAFIIVNNLTNKPVNFSLFYMSTFE